MPQSLPPDIDVRVSPDSYTQIQGADPSSDELMLEEPMAAENPEDLLFQKLSRQSRMPFLQEPVRQVRVGDEFEVMSPVYRHAVVEKVAKRSCIVTASVPLNTLSRNAKGEFVDDWKIVEWKEVWAVRKFEEPDPDNLQRIKQWVWTVVTQETRGRRAREASGIVGTVVRVVRGKAQVNATAYRKAQANSQGASAVAQDVRVGQIQRGAEPRGGGDGGGQEVDPQARSPEYPASSGLAGVESNPLSPSPDAQAAQGQTTVAPQPKRKRGRPRKYPRPEDAADN